MAKGRKLSKRMAGKWQIPLFLLSVGLLVTALFRVRPRISDTPLAESLQHMDTLCTAGAFEKVAQLGQHLLAVQDLYSERDHAAIRLRMARARHDEAMAERRRSPDAAREVIDHLTAAKAHGISMEAQDYVRWGNALTWLDDRAAALPHYELAVAGDRPGPLRDEVAVRRRIFEIRDSLGDTPESLLEWLTQFMARLPEQALADRLWAVEQRVDLLSETGQAGLAATDLVREAARFEGSDFEEMIRYLQALVLYRQGHTDQAEAALRAVRNRTDSADEVYARAGWLLGRITLRDSEGPRNPYEAQAFFRDVIKTHDRTAYGVAAHLGLGEAFAMLGRHDDALTEYRAVIQDLQATDAGRLVTRDVVRVSLGLRAEEQRTKGHTGSALAYAELAHSLVDEGHQERRIASLGQLGLLEEQRADALRVEAAEMDDADRAMQMHAEATQLYRRAAEHAEETARVSIENDELSASASWRAAEMYNKAGDRAEAARRYEIFRNEHPGHPLVPRALLRTGQLRQAEGDLEGAVEAYQACFRNHRRTIDGLHALIPLARCYMAMGSDKEELVEATLRIILDDSEVFTPEAPEYADALFLYGELLNRRSDFEGAIGKIEEALDRYPDDARVWSARALLADSYRQSGLALKDEVTSAGSAAEIEHIRAEASERFERARSLYRMLIDELAQRPGTDLSPVMRLNRRYAYVYEADCLFETGRYHEALKLYEEAASLYKETTTALAAYVQIINCHVFLGQPEEARAALARARMLVDTMPALAFDRSLSPETRKDWQRYFLWLEDAEIF